MEPQGERPVWSMSGSELLTTLDQVDADLARRLTYRLELIARLDEIGHAQDIGAHDTAQLLAFRYRLDRPDARRDVRLAKTLPKYPAVSAALPNTAGDDTVDDQADRLIDDPVEAPDTTAAAAAAGGFLRPAQAEAIVAALEKVPATVAVEDLAVAEEQLVGLARHLSPAELRKAGQRVRDLLDTDGPEPDERRAYDRESLTLIGAERGVKFRGYLANENAELLRALIHAGARPHRTITGELDPRPRDKRQADALTTALSMAAAAWDAGTTPPGAAAAGATPPGAAGAGAAEADGTAGAGASGQVPGFGAKATITVTIDLEDLKSATADAIGDLVYGDGLSAAAIRRLACDAKIIPLVLGSNSEPLDVGRAERLGNPAMRRALTVRDKGCVVCGAPPIQCEAHHLVHWIDGGKTCVSNLVLICKRHHIDLHAGDWTITITNGVVQVARPTWADPPPRPVRPDRQPNPARPPHHQTASPPRTGPSRSGPSRTPSPPTGQNPSGPSRTPSPPTRQHPSGQSSSGSPPEPGSAAPPPTPGSTPVPAEVAVSDGRSLSSPTTSGIRAGLLHRLLLADSESTGGMTPSALREAASLAIWGEAPTPIVEHAKQDGSAFSGDQSVGLDDGRPLDPWHEAASVSRPAP